MMGNAGKMILKLIFALLTLIQVDSVCIGQGEVSQNLLGTTGHSALSFFSRVFNGRKSTSFKATRRYFWVMDHKLFSYGETCLVSISPKGERRFIQKISSKIGLNGKLGQVDGNTINAFKFNVGFIHKFRDFRVFNPHLAERNYRVLSMGKGVSCGREGAFFMINPIHGPSFSFLVFVDLKSFLIMNYFAFDSSGSLSSALICSTFRVGNFVPKEGLKWWEPRLPSKKHSALSEGILSSGVRLWGIPRSSPNFVLQEIRSTKELSSGVSWLNFIYTDGLLPEFLLFRHSQGVIRNIIGHKANSLVFKTLKRGGFKQISSNFGENLVLYVGKDSNGSQLPKLMLSIYH